MKTNTADRLKQVMAERRLRQSDIVRLCEPYCKKYGVRIGRNDISQYVNGKVLPKQDKLSILGMALGVSEVWLMGYDVPREKETDGDRLRILREQHELSHAELANELHISVDDMKAYEANQKKIPSYVASAVARYFGVHDPAPDFHKKRFDRMVDAMDGQILSEEEFDKVIDYVKFIVSQRGK